ncbi:MAG TPA: helix-turn-helix transcriptional regulator [Puia sp.]|jgi:AraC-like DNA-binding protein|nr:helix-turn-helix transcriptional regulator [Puia sp.]
MIRYAYELKDFRGWARGLGKLLEVPVIRTGRLYNGVSWLVIDLPLRDDLVLIIHPSLPPSLLLQFDLETNHPTLRLTSTGNAQETTYLRNTRIRKIALLIAPSFLRHHLQKEIRNDLFRQAGHTQHPYTEPTPFEFRPLLEEIFHSGPAAPLHHLLLHNRFLLLAEKFIYSFINKTPQPQPGSINWAKAKERDVEALREVMKVLSDAQLQKFPSIEALSKTAMMSSTKLKSRFKQIYGMKLYEFYNHHRLLQAKEMLRTGKYSVKQVGVNIGFSNLSNFAKAFKKEFGVLPREILKRK